MRPEAMETIGKDWTDMVLICRSCGDTGFGPKGRDRLRSALRTELREAGLRRQIGILDVACFGICPKHAVTAALASRPGRLLVVPQGEPGRDVLQTLGVSLGTPEFGTLRHDNVENPVDAEA